MTTFDNRERAFESKFAMDEEQAFKVMSRRNKALGLWAGGVLGKDGQELDAYVREVMRSDLQHAGDEDVFAKVSADLEGRVEPAEVRRRMAELLDAAQAQIAEGR
jgi:hypothetical protein